MVVERYEEVLAALRRISRATDLHSRRMIKIAGLSSPQLLILQAIRREQAITAAELARCISLSQATITNILDRLEKRGLILRQRSSEDKRKINVLLSGEGRALLKEAPQPLQDSFIHQFQLLPEWEQLMILAALKRLAAMMDDRRMGTAPVLEMDTMDEFTRARTAALE